MIDVRLRTSPHAQTRRGRGHSWSVLISFPIIIACVERTKPSYMPNERQGHSRYDTHTALARLAIFAVSSSFSPPSMFCFSNASKDAPKAGKTSEPPSTIARITTLGKSVQINVTVTTPPPTTSNNKVATPTTLKPARTIEGSMGQPPTGPLARHTGHAIGLHACWSRRGPGVHHTEDGCLCA
jgi:hypothetical protein